MNRLATSRRSPILAAGSSSGAPGGSRRSPGDADDCTILVVDDIAANLVAVEAALSSLGKRIVTARSGTEALSRLLEEDFALVLLDVQMPEMDGFETAQMVRARKRSRHLPIIFLTAHSHDDEAVRRAYRLGAVDFLFKPLDAEVLRAKAQVFIELHERTKEISQLHVQRALDEHRRELAAATLNREIEAERVASEQVSLLNERLELADRRKTEFLAVLAHELRNPLAPIRTAVDLMRESPTAQAPRLLDIVDRQLGHITRLVDDLLDISRIAAGKIDLRLSPIDLEEVIQSAIVASQPVIEARKHVLTTYPSSVRVPVLGDAVRLVQVISNLLNNAARYTEPEGKIELAWGIRDGAAFVRVTDTGIGIDPASLEAVFEMFVQERIGPDDHGGLGLGLALARRLMELHGGTIVARSDGRNRGSTFEVRLPRADASTVVGHPRTADPPPRKRLTRPLRVLVIEDNVDIRELTVDLLAAHGHEVMSAHDGSVGLSMICEHQLDVALIDLGLPGLDGFELMRELRACCPDLRTRLVAMTGYGQEADVQRTRDAGFHGHLVKPARSAAILDAIEGEPGDA